MFSRRYLPNDPDVLHSFVLTRDITETRLQFGKLDCLLFNVSGVRSKRKKWVHVFEGVHCVIFTAPLSGYDECLVEDNTAYPPSTLLFSTLGLISATQGSRVQFAIALKCLQIRSNT